MHRITGPASIFALAILLAAPVPALAQRGGHGGGFGGMHGGFGGMRGGFGGFSSGHVGGVRGGFGGFQSGFGLPQRSFVGIGGFNRGFNSSFRFGDRHFFSGRRFFSPGFGFIGSFGYGYWPSYGYWPGYGYYPGYAYWPGYGYGADYPYSGYPYYIPSYGSEEPATNLPTERYWLVALRDNTILLVNDYWLENSTLNYVTRDGRKSSVDLGNVDLDLTKQLNQQRGLAFELPRPR